MNITKISSTEYLQRTVTTGDIDRGTTVGEGKLTAYYTASGNPPGQWVGSGARYANLNGDISASAAVALYQKFVHPVTGEVLGKRPGRQAENQLAESTKQTSTDVSGFDLTFTVPKSVSVLWALSSPDIQARIADCHDRAVSQAIEYLERRVVQSRAGHGGVASVPVHGVIAGRWRHWDNREGEPHLHSHVVVSNRVQRTHDDKWVTLDSRALYKGAVAASEHHLNLLLDELHRELGLTFTVRDGEGKAIIPDVEGLDPRLTELFSQRARKKMQLYDTYRAQAIAQGMRMTPRLEAKLRQDAWRDSRQPKEKTVTPLSIKCATWREAAKEAGISADEAIGQVLHPEVAPAPTLNVSSPQDPVLMRYLGALVLDGKPVSDPQDLLEQVGAQIARQAGLSKTTWSRANLRADVERLLRGVHATTHQVRDRIIETVVDAAIGHCVTLRGRQYALTPPLAADTRLMIREATIFDEDSRHIFTHRVVLDAEQALLDAAQHPGPGSSHTDAHRVLDRIDRDQVRQSGHGLAKDQRAAADGVLTDQRGISVIIGPAGSGKTTTMSALATGWDQLHGHGQVMGLCTSAQAASVLAREINAEALTVAKWLYETTGEGYQRRQDEAIQARMTLADENRRGEHPGARRILARTHSAAARWRMRPGQLVIIDEASMVSTHDLAALSRQATEVGAKVVMVGDPHQLDAIHTGGGLDLLAKTETTACYQLTNLFRFRYSWEKNASLCLRTAQSLDDAKAVVGIYEAHDRLRTGEDEAMLEAAFRAAREDQTAGRSCALIASTNALVSDLNERFMHERRVAGEVDARMTVPIRGDLNAGIGDWVIARQIDRKLRDTTGEYIRNGSRLTVAKIHPDGSATCRREDNDALIRLPATWMAKHIELGYAVTAHRAQGITVDHGYFVMPTDSTIPHELVYVALTRGRETNIAFIGEDSEARDENQPQSSQGSVIAAVDHPLGADRLASAIAITAAPVAATLARERLAEEDHSLKTLIARYEYVASCTSSRDLEQLLGHRRCEALTQSSAWTSLRAAWRTAMILDPHSATDSLVRPVTAEVKDEAALLASRLRKVAAPYDLMDHPAFLLGQTPRLSAEVDPAVMDLASQVENHIHMRHKELKQRAAHTHQPWANQVPPGRLRDLVMIYRDMFDVHDDTLPLGPSPDPRDTRRQTVYNQLERALVQACPPPPTPARPAVDLGRRPGM
ncbi:MobF family relaxase [Devriesea agamarum]|uniref:MobF family relaxase n=1 Tax=Devriesea agamarum TaxID=472569 RepID=UPI001E486856|nr:MobF family relaxase [Devriesea agamarum]